MEQPQLGCKLSQKRSTHLVKMEGYCNLLGEEEQLQTHQFLKVDGIGMIFIKLNGGTR